MGVQRGNVLVRSAVSVGGLEKLVSRQPFEGMFKGRITEFEVEDCGTNPNEKPLFIESFDRYIAYGLVSRSGELNDLGISQAATLEGGWVQARRLEAVQLVHYAFDN